jgi:hypothetical protein
VIDAAERICDTVMDKDDGSTARYWEMLASKEHEDLKNEMLAAYEHLHDVYRRLGQLRKQYGLPSGLDEDKKDKAS